MKSIFKNKSLIALFFITLLGALIRVWNIDSVPPSLNWDEVSHGYNAYSILKTGQDEWGKSFPLIFRAFGDYKLPVYIYLATIPVSIFGLSVFTVRFVSVLAGILAIPGIYLLAKELFTPKRDPQLSSLATAGLYRDLPLLSAFFLAISPWHIFISRPALEANLALTLVIFGGYYLIRFFNHKSTLLPASLFLGLSLHTYNTERIFVPLLLLLSVFIFRSSLLGAKATRLSKIKNFSAIIIFSLFLILVVFQVLSGEGSARYEKLKILSPSVVFQIGEAYQNSALPPVLAKLIHNRPIFFVTTVAKNYLSYFSPAFFYQTWGSQYQFAIPGQNLLSLPVFLLVIIGLIFIFKNIRQSGRNVQFLLAWLLLSPLAASLTIDPPQALRPNPMIPALVIFAAIGLSYLSTLVPQKVSRLLLFIIFILAAISSGLYLSKYFSDYKVKYSSSWQYGYEQVIAFIKEHGSEYERIFITKRYGEPHIFYSFYTMLDPKQLQPGDNNIRFSKSDWYWTDRVGNVYFINDWKIPTIEASRLQLESGESVSTAHSLLITSPDHLPVNASVIKTVNFLDGSPAFIITSVP